MGSRFLSTTVFHNYGTFTNQSTIGNEAVFNNYGAFDNTGGTFDYTDNGIYTVMVSVSNGELEYSSSFTITVNNVAPIADAGSNQTIDEGDTGIFSGSFSDPGPADTYTIAWDFGDSTLPPLTAVTALRLSLR